MPVYISQMVPYFSLFDTFMDQTQDSSIIAAADTDTDQLDIEQNWISNFEIKTRKIIIPLAVIKRFLRSGCFVLYFVKWTKKYDFPE